MTLKHGHALCADNVSSRCSRYMELRENVYYLCVFFFIDLFICLIFLHFYIWNVWFVLANNRIIKLIFLILKFMTMVLLVDMRQLCKLYLNFYSEWKYLGDSYEGRLIFSKVAGCITAVLVEVGSFIAILQVFCLFYYLFCERVFWETCSNSGCFNILSTLFILI